jgi:hypothetical protein
MKNLKLIALLCIIVGAIISCKKYNDGPDNSTTNDEVALSGDNPKSIEALSDEYFAAHADEKANAEKVVAVTNQFIANNQSAKEFSSRKPVRIQPIYSYGIDGVAYYEVWFTEDGRTVKGWILISATDKDYPLVNFSQGIPYSSRIIKEGDQNAKIFRFGVSYYTKEENGQKVAEYGRMPKYVVNSSIEKGGSGKGDSKDADTGLKAEDVEAVEGVDYFNVSDYESLKSLHAQYYYSEKRSSMANNMKARLFASDSKAKVTGYYNYRWVSGPRAYYTQIPANSGYNPYACWSGCNNNAWTNLYGWWDKNMGKASLIPTTSTGETSPLYRNTTARRNSVDPVQMYIRGVSGTYCGSGTGWTLWSNTWKGYQYAPYKGYGYSYQYRWCNSAGCHVDLANIATDGIANNYRPVYIGANSHAYLGYGWAQWSDNTDWTLVYCYPGWSENDNDDVWIWWHDFNASVKMFVY